MSATQGSMMLALYVSAGHDVVSMLRHASLAEANALRVRFGTLACDEAERVLAQERSR